MTIGPPTFDPGRTQNIISEQEFKEIRKEMIKVAGSSLKIARFIYFAMSIYGTLCIIWWNIFIVLSFDDDYMYHFSTVVIVLAVILTIVPEVIMRHYLWIYYMKKASENIQKMFDRLNIASYNARGVNWGTRQTLLYIHIRVFDPQLRSSTGHFLTVNQPFYNHQLMESQAPGGPMQFYAVPQTEQTEQTERMPQIEDQSSFPRGIRMIEYQVPVQLNFQYELPQQQFAEYQYQHQYPLQEIPEREEYQDHNKKEEEEEESQSMKMELPTLDECYNLSREHVE